MVELTNILSFQGRMAVINISEPPVWRVRCCAHCNIFYVFHDKVGNNCTDRVDNLLVVLFFKGKKKLLCKMNSSSLVVLQTEVSVLSGSKRSSYPEI